MEIGGGTCTLKFPFEVFACQTDGDRLSGGVSGSVTVVGRSTYFLALKKAFPRSFGNNGITRSFAKNKPFPFYNIPRAS